VTDTLPFDRVQIIEATDSTDGMVYDNIVAGIAAPEPGSLMLLLIGGALAALGKRRFRPS